MRLGYSERDRICCAICDWIGSGPSFAKAEADLVEHLVYVHNRVALMINRVEKHPARDVKDLRGQVERHEWPICEYEGPGYRWSKMKGSFRG